MPPLREEAVQSCIAHLTKHAAHYFRVVQAKRQEGVLWAVFGLAPDGRSATVKRASFLPLTTVLSTNAPSLIQMFNSCDHARQFVTWFTLESPDDAPVASKVMVVDGSGADAPATPQHADGDRSPMAAPSPVPSPQTNRRPRPAPTTPGHATDTAAIREELSAVTPPTGRTDGAGAGSKEQAREQYLRQLDAAEGQIRGGGRTPTTDRRKERREEHGAGGPGAALQAQYRQVMKTTMQVADSVAAFGDALDEVRGSVAALERRVEDAPVPPSQATMDDVLERLTAMEARQRQIEARVSAFDGIQERFFDQLQQLQQQQQQQQQQVLSQQHVDPLRSHAPAGDRPISYSAVLARRAELEDGPRRGSEEPATPAPTATSAAAAAARRRSGVRTPSAANTPVGSAATSRSGSAVALEAEPPRGLPELSTLRMPFDGSAPGARTDAAPSAAGRGAGEPQESLGDMIQAMESKLARIHVPERSPSATHRV